MSVRTREEEPPASRLHQVLTLGMDAAAAKEPTPTGALELMDLPEDAMALRQMGVKRVYTPKDFKITEIMGDVVGIMDKAWLVEG